MACLKCNDTGLVPFRRRDGTIVPHAWINCPDCYQEPKEYYHPIHIEDFDFALSGSMRAWTYQYCGVPDPGYIPPLLDIENLEERINNLEAISAEPGRIPRRYYNELKQVKGQLLHLQSKIIEKQKPAKSGREDITDRLYNA